MSILDMLFGKPKKLKRKRKPIEETFEDEENLDLDDEEIKVIADEIRPKKKKERADIKVPKGKALIDLNKRSYFHLILGSLLTLVNISILIVATVGWMQIIEEKILVFMYAVPSIYVTGKFTWLMIQGKRVEDEELE